MRFFSVLPNQQRQRPTESEVVHHPDPLQTLSRHPRRMGDDETASERRRRRSIGEMIPHRPPSFDDVSVEPPTQQNFMVVPVRLRDIDSNNPTCLICQEDYQIDCTISFLPCGHLYHARCINDWLHRKSTCCVCRYELPTTTVTRTAAKDLRQYLNEFQNEIPDYRCNSMMNPLADTTRLTYKVF